MQSVNGMTAESSWEERDAGAENRIKWEACFVIFFPFIFQLGIAWGAEGNSCAEEVSPGIIISFFPYFLCYSASLL